MPSATFNGQTYNFPEGTSQDQMIEYINSQNGYNDTPSPHQAPQEAPQAQPADDGSIWDTMTSGWSRMGRNVLAATVTDQDASDYELAKAKIASKEYQQERSKLGTISGFAADVGTYAPVVAAGIAAPEAGAVALGGLATADTLAQQQEAGQNYDMGNALTTGIASGVTDYATAGLASKGVNIARGLTRPTARVAGELGAQAAQAGSSNAAMTAYQNIAMGRPWDENVGEAFGVGAVAGGGLHGANMAARNMGGFAQRFQRPINDDGRRVLNDTNTVTQEVGGVHQDFANNAAEHANEYGNQFNELMDMPITADTGAKINDMVDVSMSNAGADDAALAALALAQKKGAPLTAKALDVDVGGKNLARDYLGKSERELEQAGGTLYADMSPLIFGKEKAKEKGYNTEIQMKNLRNSFDEGYAEILSPIRSLRNNLTNLIQDKNSSLYSDGRIDPNYNVALNAAKALDDGISKYSSGKALHKLDDSSLRNNSITLMRALNEVGMLKDLKNFDGTAFNPVKTARSAYIYSDVFHAQNPSIHEYNPNTLKQEGKDNSKGAVVGDLASDALLMKFGLPPVRTITRLGRNALRPMKNRKAFDQARSEADEFIQNAQNTSQARMEEHLEQGNTAAAADEAANNLRDMGINPADTTAPMETAPVEPVAPVETPVEAPVEPTPRAPMDDTMARTPSREAPVSEPVVDPEVVAAERAARQEQMAQDARVDSQRRAPVEEPVETAPEAPQEAPASTEGTSTAEAPEARTEAPSEPVDYKEKVMLPLKQREAEFSKVKNKDVSSAMPRTPEWRKAKEFREGTEQNIKRYAAQPNSGISEQGVYAAIDYHGGMDALTRTMEERGYSSVKEALPSIVSDYKVKLAEDAKAATQRVVDKVEESTQAKTIKQRDEAVAQLKTDMRSASDLVTDELFNRAVRMAEDNVPEGQMYTARQVGNFVKRLLAEEAPAKTETKTKSAKPEAKPKPTAQDSYNELNDYARDLFVDGEGNVSIPREIRKEIEKATRTRNRGNKGVGLSDSGMKNVMNKMHSYIDNELEALQAALAKPNTAQPTEVANWRRQVNNLELFRDNVKKANEAQTRRVELAQEKAKAKAERMEAAKKKADEAKLNEAIDKAEVKGGDVEASVKEAIEAEMKGKNPDEVGAISEALVNNIPENLSSTSDIGYQMFDTSVNTLAGSLNRVGLRDDAKAIRLTRDAIRDALKRKEEFPNNPDLWLSQSDMRAVNDALKRRPDQTSTYMGDLGVRARLAVFGSSNTSDMVVHTTSKLKELMAEERKRQKAAAIGEGAIGEFGINAPDIK